MDNIFSNLIFVNKLYTIKNSILYICREKERLIEHLFFQNLGTAYYNSFSKLIETYYYFHIIFI